MTEPTDTPQAAPVVRKTPVWVKVLLGVSLSLNLLIIGLIGGAAVGINRNNDGEGPGLRPLGLGPFSRAIEREDRQALRDRLDVETFRAERANIGQSLRQLQQALRANPFDRAMAEEALSGARTSTGRMQEAGHTALLDQFETMSLEARSDVADRVERALRRGPGSR